MVPPQTSKECLSNANTLTVDIQSFQGVAGSGTSFGDWGDKIRLPRRSLGPFIGYVSAFRQFSALSYASDARLIDLMRGVLSKCGE